MSPQRRVLVLMHAHLVPPANYAELPKEQREEFKAEADVLAALESLGCEVRVVPLENELMVLRRAIEEFRPDVAFNLIEEFHGSTIYDQNVVSYLELMKVPYTGCNPRGMVLGRDKALSKQILSYHRIRVPAFAVFRKGCAIRKPARLPFPLIVKSLTEDASAGIAEASVVQTEDKLVERVEFVHRNLDTHAIAEQFVDGRELYVGVVGHHRVTVLPTQELFMKNLRPDAPRVFTLRAKWDLKFQKEREIAVGAAEDWSDEREAKMARLARRIYRALRLSGYARLDFRLDADERPCFLEANPNPDIGADAELALAAQAAGVSFGELIRRIVNLGLRSLAE